MMLEIAANSVASALAAQEGGAGRVELCTALELGGLTPSHAQIALARERLRIPLVVLIRPRAGDFLYSELECEAMQRDIETCVSLGCDGVVLGVLDANGEVDMPRCRALIAAAGKLGVTFHRAFDLSRDPARALEDIVALGCERVLTSGAQASAVDGATLIRELVTQAAGRLAVMPGAGITAQNIAALAAATGAREFHASAKSRQPSGMQHRRAVLSDMESGELRSDAGQVRAMATVLHTLS
ncbi:MULTISPECIES: copper homeostasis protein CutC [Rhodanobacter]|uniref:copper homeostasis protein CutC n=1 Tax=Rhodanobacter TaxID=75309 RepID=UPI0003FD6DC1|nr:MULTISPECIES: copper homeostasis protein CutC [Rhodanobacter]KZC21371.1 copper homeostasis protein CutC [Rhodanobacter denitrificans]UJJ49519.1 copper homeostasis protein CutC [Rhodanobacter denitrificans]UJM92233.1 copper homeostasis protein CutC [Rhodanobacter denitrificans]UJM95762.1 copper homeostasis protein CutC [Rhodanobacter denitrificans]UJN21407.1 copper homeostasis protein CutC [Rhodanobacter denitrificans]